MKQSGFFKQISERYRSLIERPVTISLLVLLVLAVPVLWLSYGYYQSEFHNFWGQVLAEAHGMLFDIAVIGILIYWLNERGQKSQAIRTYKDEIEDFRTWKSEEAAFRTVGNIKRLNREKIYSINLVECYLTRTNLSHVILKEANLNNANVTYANLVQCNLEAARLNQTNFDGSSLNQAILTHAYASGSSFKNAYLIKANLQSAFLIKSDFENAFMMEADLKGAYVVGASFKNANLYKADLRGVDGLTLEQLTEAKTLHQAKLDDGLMAQISEQHGELLLR
ncbi:pentapeptide repeat-containing protein [Porifericola rhodea]|uniref:pentapeptide repeat-containing protein n=1 Tax=Porifericola rhodea TaxID=930972 RepID=UPI002667088C|nr:pentapeptide repeat-containing protein [Porifericola rhodea]WKN32399.1 pentapeptide repeat-containing protein [Porifericola rhodea]